jgi:acetoacetyl-CoA synthetase
MADKDASPPVLWEHPDPKNTNAWKFMQAVNDKYGLHMKNWDDLHDWSVKSNSSFWEEVFQRYPIIHSGSYTKVVDETARIDSIPKWFEGVQVNFAENVLYSPDPSDPSRATTIDKEDDAVACTEVREGCTEIRDCTWKEIREKTALLANAMRARGVKKGDRVAVVASNSIDTLTVFYAVTALGGLFSSSSTDMGTKGVLDRLYQIKPKFVFADDWAVYNGKTVDLRPKMQEIVDGMSGISEFHGMVSMPRWQDKPEDITLVPRTELLSTFLQAAAEKKELSFERMAFGDPFLIVYSSGTTGMPKCIVHGIGGILINNKKEGKLHRDMSSSSTVLQYTTTGWIMYLVSCSSMIHGSRAVLYDGSPFQPEPKAILRLLESQRVTDFGTSPRYMQTLATAHPPIYPREVANLSALRRVTSTGMVLSEPQFHQFYSEAFPAHVHLSNISGGTDLAACLTMDTPLKPLYPGGCQTAALGMDVQAYSPDILEGEPGKPVPLGEAGELVCTNAFPTMPVRFWNDEPGPDAKITIGPKYFGAYFARFQNPSVWAHGDFISIHPTTKQVHLHGRADGVLNPSGVRFGSAEIYNVLDARFPDEIQDSVCVGQRRPEDEDESVLLFLLMKPGAKFTAELVSRVKSAISQDVGRRCVPKYFFETPEIPVSHQPPLNRNVDKDYFANSRAYRRRSISRRLSFLLSKSCPARSSSLLTHSQTKSACNSTTSSRRSRSWSAKIVR